MKLSSKPNKILLPLVREKLVRQLHFSTFYELPLLQHGPILTIVLDTSANYLLRLLGLKISSDYGSLARAPLIFFRSTASLALEPITAI